MMKSGLRVLGAAFIASMMIWSLGGIGYVVLPVWIDRYPVALTSLGSNMAVFFVLCLFGYAFQRFILTGRGKLAYYALGGAVVGCTSGMIATLAAYSEPEVLPYAFGLSAIAGLGGALVLLGSGSLASKALEPIKA